MTELTLVADTHCQTGENPLWHPLEKRLYWTDIPAGKLYRFDPETNQHELCYDGRPVGGFTIQADGSLLLFMDEGGIARWSSGTLTFLYESRPEVKNGRFNDVIADPAGRVFCGTMPTNNAAGQLFRLDPNGRFTPVLDDLGIPNGLGFTPNQQQLYFTDSTAGKIYRFSYDVANGHIFNQTTLITIPGEEGAPDGLTVDIEGKIWSARWDGAALFQYNEAGQEQRKIDIPARKVTSVAFGGEGLADMYITTALDDGSRKDEGSGAGGLFRLRLEGVKGRQEFYSRIDPISP